MFEDNKYYEKKIEHRDWKLEGVPVGLTDF